MKKLLQYHTMIWLTIVLLAACSKGEVGPEGPEGPPGNQGPPGSNGGAANGVLVYTTDLETVKFTWTQDANAKEYFSLGRRGVGSSGSYDHGYYIDDPEGQIPGAMILVYLKMKKGTDAAPWYNMPFLSGNIATATEYYTASANYLDQNGNNDILAVTVSASLKQLSPPAVTSPSYTVQGLRVVIIPAGETEEFRTATPDASLTFEQLVERYNLREKDFRSFSAAGK